MTFLSVVRAVGVLLVLTAVAQAQVAIPNYWDTRLRLERPNLPGTGTPIRVVTAPDHPPFNFATASGELRGFNVELARAACAELGLTCTIQALSFETLLQSLREGRADVAVAGIAPNAEIRRDFEVGNVYLRSPGRFVVRRDSPIERFEPEALAGRRIAVETGSAHAAFLQGLFEGVEVVPFEDAGLARAALVAGQVDALFGDAVTLALWLNGTASVNCCAFRGGPFTESRYFGEGYFMVFRPNGEALRRAFNFALARLAERGTYTELYLRWFPIGLN
jgi:polar amino acid transport system substrate-binding protein